MVENKNTRQRQFPTNISTTSFVKLYTLHLLRDGEYYGNKVIDEISSRLNNKWSPSPGMVYPLLRELESEGYIVGRWDEPEKRSIKRYRITDKGLEHYKVLIN
ncbi:MAG TPA: PadR family transcriptional regulator, partial [Tissierellaceae bacterium]